MSNDIEQNCTMIQAFEANSEGDYLHWRRIVDVLPELADIGITAMWLPHPAKAIGEESGYDVFNLYNLDHVDHQLSMGTKYGTKRELLRAIKKAKRHGIVTYIDAVIMQALCTERTEKPATTKVVVTEVDPTEVDPDDRTEEVSGIVGTKDWASIRLPGRHEKYSLDKLNFDDLRRLDYGAGMDWAQSVVAESSQHGQLMSADTGDNYPFEWDMIDWGNWIIKETGAVGFRFGPIKHMDCHFVADFIKSVRENANDPNLFAVGEYCKDDLSDSEEDLEEYLDSLGTQFSIFDTLLHYNFKEAGDRAEEYDMRAIWDSTIVQKRHTVAVTLVDNHDTQVGQKLESWVSPAFKPLAYALILLRPSGYPCVFWGDLYGTEGDNPQQPVPQLDVMIRARNLYAHGELRDYWDHMNCVGWVRMGKSDEGQAGCAVVLCNGSSEGSKRMDVGKEHAGEKWKDLLGWYQGEIVIEDDGWAEFKCSARSVSIWVKEGAGKE
ncbi:putative alpha-amylase [Guyanagaster necrorhizus]|uniref:Alpha-amylase n=1 Tax=Guyanagaster necrorhizus TaxID=856835 RepID=A0A9P7VEK9_9AGAR|nr:putative alpha-amylase [Guyanagaster necrorhizus MCA 3950]KAG7439172.1 putative alpha-amylase [Guyanagaster necrorhizus MCA 3950]